MVAAPIGSSSRSQLNIYEQVNSRRPCFAVATGRPAVVNPLLSSFDFSGICGRYIDANGYSVRVGNTDLATVYRLSVVNQDSDTVLMALPTRPELLAVLGPEGLATLRAAAAEIIGQHIDRTGRIAAAAERQRRHRHQRNSLAAGQVDRSNGQSIGAIGHRQHAVF